MVKQLKTVEEFKEATSTGLVLVDFFATWCQPCRALAPELEKIQSAEVVKVDVDELKEVANQYGIMSVPTMILFKDGEVVGRTSGYMPAEVIEESFIQPSV